MVLDYLAKHRCPDQHRSDRPEKSRFQIEPPGRGRRHGLSQQIAAGRQHVRSVPRNDALEQLNDLTTGQ